MKNDICTLITGATGLLGTALVKENRRREKIKGVYLGNYEMRDTDQVNYISADVTDKDTLFKLFRNEKIDCIIHAAGIADTDRCERELELAYASNVIGTRNVIKLARMKKAKLVYISTNAVFDGKSAPYGEDDEPNPINSYGKIKLECERLVREQAEDYLIIRPILMYGINNPHERQGFFLWILEKLKKGEGINIVNDVYENPVLSDWCADIIWRLIQKDAGGIYHLAGRDVLSRYQAAKIMAEVFSLDEHLLHPVSSDFFKDLAPRPKNSSYATVKIERELGVKPPGFKEGMLIFRERTGGHPGAC